MSRRRRAEGAVRNGRLLLALALILASVFASSSPASAHATLVQSDPANGSVLDEAPDSVTLTFNESVSPESSSVELVDIDGDVHPAEILENGSDGATLVIAMGEVPDGLYSLRWTAFSASDGHVTRGMMVWGFGEDADLTLANFAETSQPIPPSEVLLRWAMFMGLGLVLGGLVVESLVLAPMRARFTSSSDQSWHSNSSRAAATWARRGGLIASGSVLLLVAHQLWSIASETNQPVGQLIDSSLLSTLWGQWAIMRFVALAAVVLTLRGRTRLTGSRGLVLSLVAVALLAEAAAGHAAGTDSPVFSIANDFVHLAASIAWIGGVFVLWRVLRIKGSGRPDRLARVALGEFSPFAAAAVATAVTTGFLALGPQIRSLDALIGSDYGRTMLVKLLAVGGVLLLALATRSGLSPKGNHLRIGRESIATGVIIAAAALLTASAPANGIEWLPVVRAESRQLAVVQDDIQLGLEVTPNVPGQNIVLVGATSTRRPTPAAIDRILVRVTPTEIDVEAETFVVEPTDEFGEYQIPTTHFAVPGPYKVDVIVRRIGLPDVTAKFDWTVASPTGARSVVISDSPIDSATSTMGAAGVVVFISLMLWRGVAASVRDRRLKSVERFLIEDERERGRVDP